MLIRMARPHDEGFTLVELLIAIVIMGTAVAAIVTAMGGLVLATNTHRGMSQVEDVSHNVAQQILAKYNFATTLDGAIGSGDSKLCVRSDPALFLTSDLTTVDITVDQEVMSITGPAVAHPLACPSSWQLPVQRGVGNTTAVAHVDKSPVHQLFVCPGVSAVGSGVGYVMPTGGDAYVPPSGVTVSGALEYSNATDDSFPAGRSQADCMTDFKTRCFDNDAPSKYDLLPECDLTVERVTLTLTDINRTDGAATGATSCATGAVCTTTQVILRRGTQ